MSPEPGDPDFVWPGAVHNRSTYVHKKCRCTTCRSDNARATRALNARHAAGNGHAPEARVYEWRGHWRVVCGVLAEAYPTRLRAFNRASVLATRVIVEG